MNLDRCHSNFLAGLALFGIAVVLAGFGAALMGSDSGEIARALAPIVAAIVGGSFVLAAALIAWNAVQAKIDAEENADRRRFRLAVTAELLNFSNSVIAALSLWNARANRNTAAVLTQERWPILPHPHVYTALIEQVGALENWVASAVVGFYGHVLDLNELSKEAMQGRPTIGENTGTLAQRFRDMSNYLAAALDGLNSDRPFVILGHDLTALIRPDGTTVASSGPTPQSLQELLRVLAGATLIAP